MAQKAAAAAPSGSSSSSSSQQGAIIMTIMTITMSIMITSVTEQVTVQSMKLICSSAVPALQCRFAQLINAVVSIIKNNTAE